MCHISEVGKVKSDMKTTLKWLHFYRMCEASGRTIRSKCIRRWNTSGSVYSFCDIWSEQHVGNVGNSREKWFHYFHIVNVWIKAWIFNPQFHFRCIRMLGFIKLMMLMQPVCRQPNTTDCSQILTSVFSAQTSFSFTQRWMWRDLASVDSPTSLTQQEGWLSTSPPLLHRKITHI